MNSIVFDVCTASKKKKKAKQCSVYTGNENTLCFYRKIGGKRNAGSYKKKGIQEGLGKQVKLKSRSV